MIADTLAKDVNAALIAAGERPAARGESGFMVACGAAAVLVTYRASGTGEAVLRRDSLTRWLRLLGESGHGWTVTGIGSRRIAAVRVTLPEGDGNG
jgi:hypothetical protein